MNKIEKIAVGGKILEGLSQADRQVLDAYKRPRGYYRIDNQEQFNELLESDNWFGNRGNELVELCAARVWYP